MALSELEHYPVEALLREAMQRCFPGVDLENGSMVETPTRVERAWKEFHKATDMEALLKRSFDNSRGSAGLVVQQDIPFSGLCEHHLFPFFGKAYIGYKPNKNVVGLSKIARVVQAAARRRPSVQETLTEELCELFFKPLESLGAIVVLKAEHTCMSCRGVSTPGVRTITASVKGVVRGSPNMHAEFYSLINLGR